MKTNRPAEAIKRDMLEWARENLYARIGEEWDYNGQDFDPLVHLLVGACASEVKNIHDAIDGADRRMVKKLAELLLPEHAHLPVAARALATATPAGSLARISEKTQFRYDADGHAFYFTPACECTILNSTLKVVGSDGLIFEYKPEQPRPTGQYTHASRILLGFESPKPIITFDNVLFYFNLLGENHQVLFLRAIAEGAWKINGQPVDKFRGFRKSSHSFADQADPHCQAVRETEEMYRPYFLTVQEYPEQALSRRNISEVVLSWLRENNTSTPGLEQQANALPAVEENFFWIEIQLPYPVRVFEFEKNFRCATTIFPVLNRQLHVKDDADTFLNRPVIDVLCITPEKPFLGVHRVENIQNKETIPYLPLAQLSGSKRPAYSVRCGGVGRIDNFNAWNRLSYLLGLFREEHRYRDVLERAGDKVSLEELHLLIGDKVLKEEPPPVLPERDVYFFLQPGDSPKSGIRAGIQYWTTEGAKANRLPPGKALVCDPPDPILRKEGIMLMTAPVGGKDAPDETEYFHQLRDNLMHRERIITGSDVTHFCRRYLGASLRQVTLLPGVGVDPRPEVGISRVLQVVLEVDQPGNPVWAGTCQELEYLLNEKSDAIIPYVVKLKGNGND